MRTFNKKLNVSTNKPSFSVHKNGSNQAVSTIAIVTWSTEEFDTNSNFASNRFTPTVAGKYLLTSTIDFQTTATVIGTAALYKNGALYKRATSNTAAGGGGVATTVSAVVDANGTTDYFEIYASTGTSETINGTATDTYFTGCKID